MNSTPHKPVFHFTKSQRTGIILLLSVIIGLQLFAMYGFRESPSDQITLDEKKWLAFQPLIDSMKIAKTAPVRKVYPYNPNFISDEKGYILGMSVAEIDRLHAFRAENKYVNSAAEFQAVTKISDSLLAVLSPNFKFPDWVTDKARYKSFKKFDSPKTFKIVDINQATADELIAVYGIGPALSERILKQREILGGFVSMDQMEDVWGISETVAAELRKKFHVSHTPGVVKININDAPISALSKFPYFRYQLAKNIVTYRSMNGKINSAEDLAKIKDFPAEKIEIITVYLEF